MASSASSASAMDLAKRLVRIVARSFYEIENVVVIDALVKHNALSATDLSIAMHLSPSNSNKIVQRLVAKLREGGLVSVYTRQELRDGAQKAQARDYYFIDYRRAIDSTKYRLSAVQEKILAASNASMKDEKKECYCQRCKSQYTLMEVLDMVDPQRRGIGFLCRRCGHYLSELEEDMVEKDDTTALFNKQFEPILRLLESIDHVFVPETTGEQALAEARPMPRTELNPAPRSATAVSNMSRPTAVKGQATGPEKMEVAITSESENSAAQRAAESDRRARVAAQNQLPEWHTRSTITNEVIKGQASDPTLQAAGPATTNGEVKDEQKEADDKDQMDQFFQDLEWERLEKERQEREEEEDDDDDEDEDDDDFEDVGINGTPAASGTPLLKVEHMNGGGISGTSSINGSAATTPAAGAVLASSAAAVVVSTPKESDADDDDDDFEDVPPAPPSLAGTKRGADADGTASPTKKIRADNGDVQHPAVPGPATEVKAEESDEDEFEDVV